MSIRRIVGCIPASLLSIAGFFIFTALARPDTLTVVTSAAGQNATDSIGWSQLGADGTVLGSAFTVKSAAGTAAGVALGGPNSIVSVVCSPSPASQCSWTGHGATANDVLVWTSDAANGGNGPVTLNFATGISGAGALIQADAPGQFTAQLQVFNGSTQLASYTLNSDANGDPLYIGALDSTGANITSVVFNVTTCTDPGGVCNDFALDTVQVTVPAPLASLSSTTLNFGNQQVGTTSAAQPITLTNNGTKTLNISSINATGDYGATNTCGTSLPAGGNCNINVTFTPSTTGTRTGSVLITDNAAGSPQSVSLSGTGTAPAVSLSPSPLTFGSQQDGTTSSAQVVTLKNTGTATLTVSSIVASSSFAETNNCGTSVAAGSSCSINVTFSPGTTTGTINGTLTVTDNASGSPHTVSLSGTGTAVPAPAVSLSPSPLNFGSQQDGTTSSAQVVTLKNTGTATLTVSSIVASSSFAETNNCGTSVSAGSSCSINVTFSPGTTTGTINGTLTVTDNASGSPHTVSLSGTGTAAPAPAVSLSPSPLNFGSQQDGTTSSAQVVTLKNTGTATLTVSSIVASSSFAETNNCGTSVSAGSSCSINVTFSPGTTTGTINGTLTVTDNASGSPHTVSLSGTGTAPAVNLNPTSLTFASQNEGTTSAAQTVTLKNTGTATLTISSIVASSSYAETNTCGSSLAAGSSCSISVTFTPSTTGTITGTLTVTDNASGSPHKVSLTGTGASSGPPVTLSATSLTFGNQIVNTSSAAQTVTLTNNQTTALTVSSFRLTTGWTETNTCGTSVAAGASCTISVTFKPTTTGSFTGTMSVYDSATGSPQKVSLSGTGVQPVANFSSTTVTFPSQQVGTTSAAQTVTLKNTGTATMTITNVYFTSGFGETNTCGSSLAVGASCTISITFSPKSSGTITGNVRVYDNASGSPQYINLTGTAVQPTVTLNPTSLTFASQAVGTTSAAQTVTLQNTGTAPLTITSVLASTSYAQTNNCGTSVAVGASCTISITFAPRSAATITGYVKIYDNASGSPQSVTLSGTGVAPAVTLSAASFTFPAQKVGTTSAAQTVTVKNSGTAALAITSVRASTYFAETNNCGSSLAAGSTCLINVTFKPTKTGTVTGSVTIYDNASGGRQTVSLSGTGK